MGIFMNSKTICRSISLLLVLVICFTTFPCVVLADDTISTEPIHLPTLEDVLAGNVTPTEFDFFITKGNNSATYDILATASVSNGTYYINNRYCGKYLAYSSSATTQSGTISSLGNSILWEISSVSGGYTIRSKSDTTKYLGVPSSTSSTLVSIVTIGNGASVPSTCIWSISTANNGGILVKNTYNSKYLCSSGDALSTSSSIGTTGSSEYDSRVWRIATSSYYGSSGTYKELTSYTISSPSISIGEPINPTITKSPSNTLWTSASDFAYSIGDPYYVDYRTGTLIGAQGGSKRVTATHKVTGKTTTFAVIVSDSIFSATCIEGATYNARSNAGNNCSGLSTGITWSSSDTSVATVSSSGIVTGRNSGYALISAKNVSDETILVCEIKVTNALSQKLAAFTENEIQYLYCKYTYLNDWTRSLPDSFEYKVKILDCLRSYYTKPEDEHPSATELIDILDGVLSVDESSANAALALFNECYLGYLGLYNREYINDQRVRYFNYLKEMVTFCAFGLAANLDPVNTNSDCADVSELINVY